MFILTHLSFKIKILLHLEGFEQSFFEFKLIFQQMIVLINIFNDSEIYRILRITLKKFVHSRRKHLPILINI